MYETMKLVSYALILVSAVFKGVALMHLSNQKNDFGVRQTRYKQFNLLCYLFLLPGILLFAYAAILH